MSPETATTEDATLPAREILPADSGHVHKLGRITIRLSSVFVPSPATAIVNEDVDLALTVNGDIEAVPVPFPPTERDGSGGPEEF